jgi:Co/Zn/Cd efflux system component
MPTDNADRKRMRIVFAANIVMFIIGLIGRHFAESTGLLADAFGYAIAMLALGRAVQFQKMRPAGTAPC